MIILGVYFKNTCHYNSIFNSLLFNFRYSREPLCSYNESNRNNFAIKIIELRTTSNSIAKYSFIFSSNNNAIFKLFFFFLRFCILGENWQGDVWYCAENADRIFSFFFHFIFIHVIKLPLYIWVEDTMMKHLCKFYLY